MHSSASSAPSPNPACCPLCGAANLCAEEQARSTGQPQEPCWCMQERIPAAVLERIPPSARGLACVCPQCATRTAASN